MQLADTRYGSTACPSGCGHPTVHLDADFIAPIETCAVDGQPEHVHMVARYDSTSDFMTLTFKTVANVDADAQVHVERFLKWLMAVEKHGGYVTFTHRKENRIFALHMAHAKMLVDNVMQQHEGQVSLLTNQDVVPFDLG